MENIKSKSLSPLILIPLLSLIFIRPFFSGLAYPKSELYYEILIISLAAFTFFMEIKNRFKILPDDFKYFPALALLSAYSMVSLFSINKINSAHETLKFISFASVFFIVSQIDDKQKTLLIKTIVIAGAIISAYAIYQYFWGYGHTLAYLKKINSDFLNTSSYANDILLAKRAIGTFPSPNMLGGYLIMVFFLNLHLLSTEKHPSAFSLEPRANMFYLIIITAALLFTKSLGAWLALIAALIIWFILSYKSIKHRKIILITSLAAIFLAITFILITRWERLMNLSNPQNSITQRLNYWRTAIAVIKDHPILGVGPGNFQEVFLKYKIGLSTNTRYAHNVFLHTWAETGILGLIALIYLVIAFLNKAKIKSKYIFLAGLAFLFHNLIDNTYFIPEAGFLWWVLAWDGQ